MVKALTYDVPGHKMKLKIRQFRVMSKNTRQVKSSKVKSQSVLKYLDVRANLLEMLCFFSLTD